MCGSNEETTHQCGFCLGETNHTWKCSHCSWEGHPGCWLMLRQEVWSKYTLTHVPSTKCITPWKLPKGKCPQCRREIAWAEFIEFQRTCDQSKETKTETETEKTCWICQETLNEENELKNIWQCSCARKPACHYTCLYQWSGYGVCQAECIDCGRKPSAVHSRMNHIEKWQAKITELKKTIQPESFFYLFFADTKSQGAFQEKDAIALLTAYMDFLQHGFCKNPIQWWQTMYPTSMYLYKQLQTVQTVLLSGHFDWLKDGFFVSARDTISQWLTRIQKAQDTVQKRTPAVLNLEKNYSNYLTRVSPALPGEYFPARWFKELTSKSDYIQSTSTSTSTSTHT
jgi:hypothetical protein